MLYLRLAIDNIFSQFKRFIISALLVVVSLVVIIYLIVTYTAQGYGYNECDKLLAKGFEGTAIITIDDENLEGDIKEFIQEIYNRKEISAVGGMETYSAHFSEEIYNIQNENTEGIFVTNQAMGTKFISAIAIDKEALDICKFNLSEGIDPDELNFSSSVNSKKEEIITYVYLGSAYESIPIGTEYRTDTELYSYVCIVAGIMEEGQRWLDPSIVTGMSAVDMDYTIDCTYGVIGVSEGQWVSNELWLSPNDGYSLDEAIATAYEVADKYDINLWSRTLTEVYETSCEETIELLSYFADAMAIIMPAIILMLITMQIVSIMYELNQYGIMCSIGYSIRDINIMLIIKNIIMALIGMVIATPIVMYIVKGSYQDDFEILLKTVMISAALPMAMIILMAVILITSATSIVMLKRYTPVKLMGKRN